MRTTEDLERGREGGRERDRKHKERAQEKSIGREGE